MRPWISPQTSRFFHSSVCYCVSFSTRITFFFFFGAICLALSSWAPPGLQSAYMFFFLSCGSQASLPDAVNTVFCMSTCSGEHLPGLCIHQKPPFSQTRSHLHWGRFMLLHLINRPLISRRSSEERWNLSVYKYRLCASGCNPPRQCCSWWVARKGEATICLLLFTLPFSQQWIEKIGMCYSVFDLWLIPRYPVINLIRKVYSLTAIIIACED